LLYKATQTLPIGTAMQFGPELAQWNCASWFLYSKNQLILWIFYNHINQFYIGLKFLSQ
jgi:hypothetical protein